MRGQPRVSMLSSLPLFKEQNRQLVSAFLYNAAVNNELDIQTNDPAVNTYSPPSAISVAPNEAPVVINLSDNASKIEDQNQLVTSIQGVFHPIASAPSDDVDQYVKFWVNKPGNGNECSRSQTPPTISESRVEIDKAMGSLIKGKHLNDKFDVMGNSLLESVKITPAHESPSSTVNTTSSAVWNTDKHADHKQLNPLSNDWLALVAHQDPTHNSGASNKKGLVID